MPHAKAKTTSTQRNVKTLHVRNRDTTPTSVTVVYDANGTDTELHKALLNAEDVHERTKPEEPSRG